MTLGKLIALLAAVSVTLLGGCAAGVPASPTNIEKSRTFNKPFDDVWNATLDTLSRSKFKTAKLEIGNGQIVTSERDYSPYDANEGKRGSVMVTPDQVKGRSVYLDLLVTSSSPDTTNVQVNSIMRMEIESTEINISGIKIPSKQKSELAYSNGNIEKSVLDDIANRLTEIAVERETEKLAAQKRNEIAASERKQIEKDNARGFNHISFSDFQLDAKTIPLGTKLAITGFYQVTGQIETLVETIIATGMPNAYRLFLLTEDAPRDTRMKLLNLRKGSCGYGICQLTVLGHVSKCSLTWLGKPVSMTTCLAVDELRDN